MKKTQTNRGGVLSVLCYILAVLFLLYGIYMGIYAIDYIQSYESTGLIDMQNLIQYVVTSSASYLGFAVLLFAAGSIIRMLKNLQPALIGTITEEFVETGGSAAEMPAEPGIPETAEVFAPEGSPADAPDPIEESAEEPEPAPAEALPAKETPDAFEEASVPEIGDTSSALTFHELIIDPPKPDQPIEKISSSMIRDIFERR